MNASTTPPSGFRDFLPEACAARAKVIDTISRVYRSFGFQPIATSAVEDLPVLLGKGGGENEKLIFKILKRGEKLERASEGGALADLGLRFDLTLPLARYYSRHGGQLPNPFKAYHIGPVWRAERAQKGRYREFYQCDADIVGSESLLCEVEVITAIDAAFRAFKIEPVIWLSDRGLLFSILDQAGVPADKRGAACVLLDKLDKADKQEILAELARTVGDGPAKILGAQLLSGNIDRDLLSRAAPEARGRLNQIMALLKDSPVHNRLELRPSLVRGFDYYTGPVFEFRHPRLAGSIGGGGRYDRLTEQFSGKGTPACGGSIGFERLMLLLEESGEAVKAEKPRACVTVFSPELLGHSLKTAAQLRAAGWDVDIYAGTGKLKAQFKYADQRGVQFAIVIGPEEAAAGKIKVKELKTGQERLLTTEILGLENVTSRG